MVVDAGADLRNRAARPAARERFAAEEERRLLGCRAPAKLMAFVALLGGGEELRDVAELPITLFEQLFHWLGIELCKVEAELLVDHGHSARGVILCAALRLSEDVVDAAEVFRAERGVFESRGGVLLLAGILP